VADFDPIPDMLRRLGSLEASVGAIQVALQVLVNGLSGAKEFQETVKRRWDHEDAVEAVAETQRRAARQATRDFYRRIINTVVGAVAAGVMAIVVFMWELHFHPLGK